MIELRNITVRLGERTILDGVDLTVRRGETMVILGASGSGKSTILRVIIGLVRPDEGQILIDGEDVTAYTERQWNEIRRRMGMVFQYSALFDSMTVADNVAFGLRRHGRHTEGEVRREVAEALARVGLDGWQDAMPANLSGGMKKRVSLARALATHPDVVLYDEPTAGLDPIRSATVDRLIMETQQTLHTTAVVVTHELVSARKIADRMAFLHQGKFLEIAPTAEFLRSKKQTVQQFLQGEESVLTDESVSKTEDDRQ